MAPIIDKVLALRGWQREEINGNEYELNSIITEKWEGKKWFAFTLLKDIKSDELIRKMQESTI
ncbi:MAG: hypothetical protein IJ534_02615 [Bacteroidaceae bacterium]|nr:hypothetical protein [Bacteroidaceae bacterium]